MTPSSSPARGLVLPSAMGAPSTVGGSHGRALGAGARAYRFAHAAWAIVALGCLSYIWVCAVVRRRDRALGGAVCFLLVQGAGLVVGRGDCPLSPLQRRLGDPVPLFELVLPPRAAKAAIPALAAVTVGGLLALVVRGRPERR